MSSHQKSQHGCVATSLSKRVINQLDRNRFNSLSPARFLVWLAVRSPFWQRHRNTGLSPARLRYRRAIASLCASLLLGLLLNGQAGADTIRALVDLRSAKALFEQNRFRDADRLLQQVYTTLQPTANLDPERFIQVLDLVGQTKSSLGQHAEVVILMQQRLQIAMFHFGDDAEELAPAMAGLAEAFYRAGDNRRAIQFANEARFRFMTTGTAPDDYLKLLENNLNKYRLRKFERSELPTDLSEFYTRCEGIRRGSLPSDVDMIMGHFVEIGVDFHPQGFWGQMYQIAAMGPKGNLRSGVRYRRLFLPATDDATRTNLCVVDQTNGRVVSAESTIE